MFELVQAEDLCRLAGESALCASTEGVRADHPANRIKRKSRGVWEGRVRGESRESTGVERVAGVEGVERVAGVERVDGVEGVEGVERRGTLKMGETAGRGVSADPPLDQYFK